MQWIDNELAFNITGPTSTFEIIIRVLGGLLSAYELSGEPLLLAKAKDMGERLMPVFNTSTGLPLPIVDLSMRRAWGGWAGSSTALSEVYHQVDL